MLPGAVHPRPPVSYTHLDVYKRQGHHRGIDGGGAFEPVGAIVIDIAPGKGLRMPLAALLHDVVVTFGYCLWYSFRS